VPDTGVPETLTELRRRGVRIGLLSNCTEDVALAWPETPFAGHFDVEVFSATAGCAKPEPRIYELVLRGLRAEPSETIFVGDGANDELEGARRAGITPVLYQPDGSPARSDGLEGWTGHRIARIPDVLDLLP